MKIALHRGRGIIGRLIKWQTRGPYSHASVLIDHQGTLIEAREFKGVRVANLHDYPPDEIDLFSCLLSRTQAATIREFLWAQVGKPYDYTMVLRFLSRRQASRKESGKWFCSELAFAAYLKAGIQLLARTEPWEVSPRMLARSTRLDVSKGQHPLDFHQFSDTSPTSKLA